MTNLSIVSFTVYLLDKTISASKELFLKNTCYNIVPIDNIFIISIVHGQIASWVSDISRSVMKSVVHPHLHGYVPYFPNPVHFLRRRDRVVLNDIECDFCHILFLIFVNGISLTSAEI